MTNSVVKLAYLLCKHNHTWHIHCIYFVASYMERFCCQPILFLTNMLPAYSCFLYSCNVLVLREILKIYYFLLDILSSSLKKSWNQTYTEKHIQRCKLLYSKLLLVPTIIMNHHDTSGLTISFPFPSLSFCNGHQLYCWHQMLEMADFIKFEISNKFQRNDNYKCFKVTYLFFLILQNKSTLFYIKN